MNGPLHTIAVRFMRNGRPVSVWVDELDHITDLELAEMVPGVSEAILEALKRSNEWSYDMTRFAWFHAAEA